MIDVFCCFKTSFRHPDCCIFNLVSCLSWNDGILVTASWDSTVKVSSMTDRFVNEDMGAGIKRGSEFKPLVPVV